MTDMIRVYNPSPISLNLSKFDISALGAETEVGSYAYAVEPYSFVSIPVTATRTAPLGVGLVTAAYTYTAVADDIVTFSFNPSSLTSPILQAGIAYSTTYVIKPVVFDPNKQYSVNLEAKEQLDGVSVKANASTATTWSMGTEISVTLAVNPSIWLAEGVYTDTVSVTVSEIGGIARRQGNLNIEVTKSAFGIQVHTSFELGPIPTITKQDSVEAIIVMQEVSCDQISIGDPPGFGLSKGQLHGYKAYYRYNATAFPTVRGSSGDLFPTISKYDYRLANR